MSHDSQKVFELIHSVRVNQELDALVRGNWLDHWVDNRGSSFPGKQRYLRHAEFRLLFTQWQCFSLHGSSPPVYDIVSNTAICHCGPYTTHWVTPPKPWSTIYFSFMKWQQYLRLGGVWVLFVSKKFVYFEVLEGVPRMWRRHNFLSPDEVSILLHIWGKAEMQVGT